MDNELFASIIFFANPLFYLESNLEVFYLSVDDDKMMIFTRKKDNNWIFFLSNDFRDLYKKHYGKGLFEATMYPALGRKKYQWIQVESPEKIDHLDSLKKSIENWSQDAGHYMKAEAPIKIEDGVIMIEAIKGVKSKFPYSLFNYYMPVSAHNCSHPYSVDAEKFSFFWKMSQGEVLINIADNNAPIIFGKLGKDIYPEQILAMLFPSKFFIWDIVK